MNGVITYRTCFKPGRHEWRPCETVSRVFCRGRIYATLAANRIACLNHGVITYRTRFKPGRHEWRPCETVSHVFCRGRIHATLAANRIARFLQGPHLCDPRCEVF